MRKLASMFGAALMTILVVISLHRGFHVSMVIGFSAAVALVLQRERYREFRGRNIRVYVVGGLISLFVISFITEANIAARAKQHRVADVTPNIVEG